MYSLIRTSNKNLFVVQSKEISWNGTRSVLFKHEGKGHVGLLVCKSNNYSSLLDRKIREEKNGNLPKQNNNKEKENAISQKIQVKPATFLDFLP
ncbi:uncharacterized protein LOC131994016 isoform X2 [Stomoxys calcitrans]|uniref:uncharacterized protein LOC131994016 isoform X2 n=1 Tax=Stomoxys calcitrans TaxID=35570 RepID=UPI0027E38576|nr:uncharacterized protein LOC131994016 isoform X2 [Stomoxys calcitrans]